MRPFLHLQSFFRSYLLACFIFAAGVVASVQVGFWWQKNALQMDRERFERAVETLSQRIDSATEKMQQGLQMLADAVGSREEFTEGHWQLQINRLSLGTDYPGLVEVGLSDVVLATNLPPEFAAITPDDFASGKNGKRSLAMDAYWYLMKAPSYFTNRFRFNPRQGDLPPLRPGPTLDDRERVWECIVKQWPAMTERRTVGFDKKRQPVFGTTLALGVPSEAIARHWSPRLSEAVQLLQKSKKIPENWRIPNAFLKRRHGSTFVYASIHWPVFCQAALSDTHPEIAFELFAGKTNSPDQWLARSGSSSEQPMFQTSRPVRMYGDRWHLSLKTTPFFEAGSTRYRAWIAFLGGPAVSALFAGLVAIETRARLRQEKIARDLLAANTALAKARDERARLGRDLHDGAIQSLYALRLGLNTIDAKTPSQRLNERLAHARQSLLSVIGELRCFILFHEPESNHSPDLEAVLKAIVARFQQNAQIPIEVRCQPGVSKELNQTQSVQVANIAREALSNSLRHSGAGAILITFTRNHDGVALEITDDGCGFDPGAPPREGLGLASMRSRAREINADLITDSAPGKGTVTRLVIIPTSLSRSSRAVVST